jgi:16S rRNA (cytosine1402-N4)-methyltransferase
MDYHDPVMLMECMEGLNIKPDGTYVDVTYGGGGHSKAILERLGKSGKLIAFDQDEDAIRNKATDSRLTLIRDNFRFMQQQLQHFGQLPVNGILADLGVSSHQLDVAARGFSTRFEHDLDMRMDNRAGVTALNLLNTLPEKELVSIFSMYGEIPNSKTLANAIVKSRAVKPFAGSADFRTAINHLVPKANASQYLARLYQALRISVNDEMDALKNLLVQSAGVLTQGGRLVVMSYHSLEDRLVKNFMSKGNFEGTEIRDIYGNTAPKPFKMLTKKPVMPSEEEQKQNPRSRSARLRIAERIMDNRQ